MTKFHRLSFLTTICFLALFIFISHANALFDSNVDKAKEFMQAGMYPQAIALLEKEINDDPTNAGAHFQLGICYINQNNYSSADERFASAVRLKPDYGYKIGKEYKIAAEYNLNKGTLSSIRSLYDKAIEYAPSLKNGIAQELFDKGKQNRNDFIFSLAVSYDSRHRHEIADYYYTLSQKNSGEISLSLLKKANEYSSGKYDKEIGNLLLIVANSQESKDTRENYIKEAAKYVSQNDLFISSVQFYTKLWGSPEKVMLDKEGWVEIGQFEVGDKIHYLSMEKYKLKTLISNTTMPDKITSTHWGMIDYDDTKGGKTPVWFNKHKNFTTVYMWIERNDSPFK